MCDGMGSALRMIHMNFGRTFRRRLSIGTEIDRLQTRRAVQWQNGKAETKEKSKSDGQRAQNPTSQPSIKTTSNSK